MPGILRNLPFYDRPTNVQVRGRSIPVKRDQIIVWVSLSEIDLEQLDPNTPRFPAILDTGCNHSFAIRQQHLIEWAGIQPDYLPKLKSTRLHGSVVPQLSANIWLHRNLSGDRDEFSARPPFQLETEQGIAVVPEAEGRGEPRLPLLGLRAIRWNHLHVAIDGHRRLVNIRTRWRLWIS